MSPFSYSNSNFALLTNLFDGRISNAWNRKYKCSNMVAPVTSYELTAAQRSMLSDSKSFEWNLKAWNFNSGKYIMPKQHVASLKSDYAIPLAERERTCLEMTDTRIYDRDHSHDGALMAPQYRFYLEKHSSVRLRVSSTLKHPPFQEWSVLSFIRTTRASPARDAQRL